ncbi:MAG: DNA-binding protein [Firmicutes bacterium]|nr:DNA-binding protein [Bacillota bacterium]
MEYRRFGEKLFVRIDKDEEILEQLAEVAKAENIRLAAVSAIGALGRFSVGTRCAGEKRYLVNDFEGDYELLSLNGNITTMNGEFYPHIHIAAADAEGNAFGGHLNFGYISATCEMIISVLDGEVERQADEITGLNLMSFMK